jgi:RNA polymerase-binding transcription factor DksA
MEPTERDYGAVLAESERVLDEVDGALERLDAGTYGQCEMCGAAIEDDRLATTPLARTCALHLSASAP